MDDSAGETASASIMLNTHLTNQKFNSRSYERSVIVMDRGASSCRTTSDGHLDTCAKLAVAKKSLCTLDGIRNFNFPPFPLHGPSYSSMWKTWHQ